MRTVAAAPLANDGDMCTSAVWSLFWALAAEPFTVTVPSAALPVRNGVTLNAMVDTALPVGLLTRAIVLTFTLRLSQLNVATTSYVARRPRLLTPAARTCPVPTGITDTVRAKANAAVKTALGRARRATSA